MYLLVMLFGSVNYLGVYKVRFYFYLWGVNFDDKNVLLCCYCCVGDIFFWVYGVMLICVSWRGKISVRIICVVVVVFCCVVCVNDFIVIGVDWIWRLNGLVSV